MKIERLKANEIPSILNLRIEARKSAYSKITKGKVDENDMTFSKKSKAESIDSIKRLMNNPLELWFTATQESVIVGFIRARRDRKKLHIKSLFVSPNQQGKGIGTNLLKYVIKKVHGIRSLELAVVSENLPAINFYRKMGFRKSPKKFSSLTSNSGIKLERIRMVKKL